MRIRLVFFDPTNNRMIRDIREFEPETTKRGLFRAYVNEQFCDALNHVSLGGIVQIEKASDPDE